MLESGSHGREEFIFSACFISLHPLKISFFAPSCRTFEGTAVCLSLLILSANIKPQVGGKAGKKRGSALLSTGKNKGTLSRLIYLYALLLCLPACHHYRKSLFIFGNRSVLIKVSDSCSSAGGKSIAQSLDTVADCQCGYTCIFKCGRTR
jgi:hypothetical protein